MNWLKSWWNRRHEIKRTSNEGEHLTDDELRLIHGTHRCPDCDGRLLEGPHGGMAANCCCERCHSEFNLTFLECGVLGERISDAGPREIDERAWCYGL